MNHLINAFRKVRLHGKGESRSLHKPLLLLFALGRCFHDKPRMIPFSIVDLKLKLLFGKFHPEALLAGNTHYPFGRLENDGLWEIENSRELKRTSVGHLFKKELIDRNIHGGFPDWIYQKLIAKKALILKIAHDLLESYFEKILHEQILKEVGLPQRQKPNGEKMDYQESNAHDASGGYEAFAVNQNSVVGNAKKQTINHFIDYLNSLHNISASGANALAESQAMSRYFGELYEPFPLAETIFNILGDDCQRVVILTGHAGDGKSTVALDVLKRLHGLPLSEPLSKPLNDLETVEHPNQAGRQVSIVKDMSELSSEKRLQWISDAFHQSGSWLIVSNTGPLLNTLREYTHEAPGEVESRILSRLNTPYTADDLKTHTLTEFAKDLVILNMTRLDNVGLGASLLDRMLQHSGWQDCAGCSIEEACPLLLNRRALIDINDQAVERVRWIYQRLTAYEQRLTLRQMVAHLAFSLTGGMSCQNARKSVEASSAAGLDRGTDGLGQILFSECFFGYRHGKPWLESQRLRAVELNRRQFFGAPVAVDFERQLTSANNKQWAKLSVTLQSLEKDWRALARESTGTHWRSALRRLLYFFASPEPDSDNQAALYFDTFLQSPRLRDFDRWRQAGELDFSRIEQKRFCRACLRVLLEIYSGFSSSQFRPDQEYLYLTLRRPDRAVVQPTQLIVAEIPFKDFDLGYDPLKRLPLLRYQKGEPSLPLTLPLLDFIHRRHDGQLGNELSQIHLAQLDWFRAELLKRIGVNSGQNDVIMLRSGIDGQTHLHRYFVDLNSKQLELEL